MEHAWSLEPQLTHSPACPGLSASLRWAPSCLLTAPCIWSHQASLFPSLPHDHCHGLVVLIWKGLLFTITFCPQQGPPFHPSTGQSQGTCGRPCPLSRAGSTMGCFKGEGQGPHLPQPRQRAHPGREWKLSEVTVGPGLGRQALGRRLTGVYCLGLAGDSPTASCPRRVGPQAMCENLLPSLRVHERKEQKRK